MYYIYDAHGSRLPYVRISRIELNSFKGVRHGVIDFNCSKEFVPYGTKSDLLGLYGQNGSGKSSVVEALHLLKGIICGYRIQGDALRYIDVGAGFAEIKVDYEFQYPNGEVGIVTYEVRISAEDKTVEEMDDTHSSKVEKYVCIFDEVIRTNMYSDGRISNKHTIIDTSKYLVDKPTVASEYYDIENQSIVNELTYHKRKCSEDSTSFIFSKAFSEILTIKNNNEQASKYYEILAELDLFHRNYLYVVGTGASGLVQLRAAIPLSLPYYNKPMIVTRENVFPKDVATDVIMEIEKINTVIATIIPELQIAAVPTPTKMKDGSEGVYFELSSVRGGKTFPLEYESDGIIKIISILALYILAFNTPSTTIVLDEFDSGVFEFLLGELLQIFEKSGKGQFVFTSHNLRPLEVIDKKFIRFTTSDPDNRYYKMKNVANSNNLRDIYLKEVQLGQQDVEMYSRTKSFKMVNALKKARKEQTSQNEE